MIIIRELLLLVLVFGLIGVIVFFGFWASYSLEDMRVCWRVLESDLKDISKRSFRIK